MHSGETSPTSMNMNGSDAIEQMHAALGKISSLPDSRALGKHSNGPSPTGLGAVRFGEAGITTPLGTGPDVRARASTLATSADSPVSLYEGSTHSIPGADRAGPLGRKPEKEAGGRRVLLRQWKSHFAVLRGSLLLFYQSDRDVFSFAHDAEQANQWMDLRTAILDDVDVGGSLEEAQALLKKHADLERAIAAREAKMMALTNHTKVGSQAYICI